MTLYIGGEKPALLLKIAEGFWKIKTSGWAGGLDGFFLSSAGQFLLLGL